MLLGVLIGMQIGVVYGRNNSQKSVAKTGRKNWSQKVVAGLDPSI